MSERVSLSNSLFLSISTFLAFLPEAGWGWRAARRGRSLERNTLRCSSLSERTIVDPGCTRDLQGHYFSLQMLFREKQFGPKRILFFFGCFVFVLFCYH